MSLGELYKFRDQNGTLHFVDSLEKIPLEYREKKEFKSYRDSASSGSSSKAILKGKSFQEILELAQRGNVVAQSNIGYRYITGSGVRRNPQEAVKWLTKAVEQGDIEALVNLGLIYKNADGVSRDRAKAQNYFLTAAEQGNTRAQSLLGAMLGDQDKPKEAYPWLLEAANNGDPDAMANLGRMYAAGHGVSRDIEEAQRWEKMAREARRR
mgnify:CR=1 FL=1